VDGEDSRLSGLVNGSLVTDYTLRCCCSLQVDREPDDGLSCCLESYLFYLTVVC
jgi:hypothetical protein